MSFYIKKVTATGIGKKPATVTLNKGLNLICGVSDSGKTCVLKCILFAMGGSKKPFDKTNTGYDAVNIVIEVINAGDICVSRKLGKNTIDVVSGVKYIDSGIYDADYKSNGNKNPVINELWLRLIGIDSLPMIIKNQDFERQRLKWNTLTHIFWLKEQEIEKPSSVLLPEVNTQIPYFLSCLVYLLTGNNFPDAQEQEKDEVSAAKKKAVREFVNARISHMSSKREQLQKQLDLYDGVVVEVEMQNLIASLSDTEEAIAKATHESKDLLANLLDYKEHEAEIAVTYSQFQALKSQYTADIKRLTFIVDSETHLHSVEENTTCPFCNGTIKPTQRKSYIEASKAELTRIITQLQGLAESESDVVQELNSVREKIAAIEERRSEIDALIDSELTPLAETLTNGIQSYRTYIQLQQEISLLHDISKDWQDELQKEEDKEPERTKFKPKEHFPDDFNKNIDTIAEDILEKCKYEGLNTAHFNMGTFDLEINSLAKEASHGKGYWAFINTVLGLTFRKYIHESAAYKPGLFVVDTPLLGLDDGEDDNAPTSMRNALFQYFIDHQTEGQMIIVENTKDLPDLDYENAGAKVIEFTRDKYNSRYSESRYGFLYEVYSQKD